MSEREFPLMFTSRFTCGCTMTPASSKLPFHWNILDMQLSEFSAMTTNSGVGIVPFF